MIDFVKAGGLVPVIAQDADTGETLVLAVNRDPEHAIDLQVGFPSPAGALELLTLAGSDVHASNTADHPDRVGVRRSTAAAGQPVQLPPASWTRIRPLS